MNLYKKYGYVIFLAFLVLAPFNFVFSILAIMCMIAPIMLSIFGKGRFWCGNFCPRGNFYDNILSKISKGKKSPEFFRSTMFRGFMVLFVIGVFTSGVIKNWGDVSGIGFVFYRIILITSIVAVALGIIFNERIWCNFCPMGSIAGFIAKLRGRNTGIEVKDTCVSCNLCAKKCPMGLKPSEFKGGLINSTQCISCKKCTFSCPKDSLSMKIK